MHHILMKAFHKLEMRWLTYLDSRSASSLETFLAAIIPHPNFQASTLQTHYSLVAAFMPALQASTPWMAAHDQLTPLHEHDHVGLKMLWSSYSDHEPPSDNTLVLAYRWAPCLHISSSSPTSPPPLPFSLRLRLRVRGGREDRQWS